MAKRIAIYCIYDKSNIIDEYIQYMVDELKKINCHIVVVINSDNPLENNKTQLLVDEICYRANKHYDVGAVAEVLKRYFDDNSLAEYDELVVLNNSFLGPFYPLSEMFSTMGERKELDFWGITMRDTSNFDGGEEIFPAHVQSYFYVVRKEMFLSNEFKKFWSQITEKITDFRSAICNYEFAFTKYFEDRGFKWDVYCKTPEYCTENINHNLSPYHYDSLHLIKDLRCPMLKQKQFICDFVKDEFTDKLDMANVYKYIASETEYPKELIWRHILRIYPIGDIMEGIGLCHILNLNHGKQRKKEKTLCIDLNREDYMKQYHFSDASVIFVFDFYTECDLAHSLKESMKRCVNDNLYANEAAVSEVIDIFLSEKNVGLLVPPSELFGQIGYGIEKKWLDENVFHKTYKEFNLGVPYRNHQAPIARIRGFWCRKSILSGELLQALREDRTGTVMQMMPLFAQQKGYYTKHVINPFYAQNMYFRFGEVIGELWKSTPVNVKDDLTLSELKTKAISHSVEQFIEKFEKVYIYGAGQLAMRIAKTIGNCSNLKGFIVTDLNGNCKTLLGYTVYSLDDFDATQESLGIVVAVGEKHNDFVEKLLLDKGITKYFIIR